MKKTTQKITKNYSVVVPGVEEPFIIRQTTTIQHSIKHACYLSELNIASKLQITVSVVDNRTKVTVFEVPAIDKDHAIKPSCKRDRRYAKLTKKAQNAKKGR